MNQRLERGESCCEVKRRIEYAVTVKQLLSGSVCGLVIGWSKENCEVRRRTGKKKDVWRYVGAPTVITFLTPKPENVRSSVSVPCLIVLLCKPFRQLKF